MDFKSMKRKELQALCKKHKIPANLTNLEMSNRLTEIFKEKENPVTQGLLEGHDENVSETESTNVVMNRKVKKVRFSPEHELIEFTRSPGLKSRGNSISSRNSDASVENVDSGKVKNENVGIRGRALRSRGTEGNVNEKKKGQNSLKCHDKKDDVSGVGIFDNAQLSECDVRNPGRVTRRRGKILEEVDLINAETDENRGVTRKSFRKRGVVGEGKLAGGSGQNLKSNGKGSEEVPESDKIAELHVATEPQILLRRSTRNANRVDDSAIINDDTKQYENNGIKGLKKTRKLLAADGSGVDAGMTGSKVDLDGKVVVQVEEPNKLGQRRSNRRKTMSASHENQGDSELKVENKERYPLRSSVLELVVADGVSKDDTKVPQPTGVLRRTRCKTLSVKLVPSDEKVDTDASVENFETQMHLNKPRLEEKRGSEVQKNTKRSTRSASEHKPLEVLDEFGGGSLIQQKNESKKRKRGRISGGDVMKTNTDPSSPMLSMKENKSEKAAPAAATCKVAGKRKPPSRSEEPNILDASSNQGLMGIGESLPVDALVSNVSDGTEITSNPGLSKGTSGDAGLTSSRKTRKKKQDVYVADTTVRADTKLINGNELETLDENTAHRIAELNTDSEKQISAGNVGDVEKTSSLLESDVQELIEKDITDMDKNDHEAQVFSQLDDSSSNVLIDNQPLSEGSNVSQNEGLTESSTSADILLLGDQTDLKTSPEVTETEADRHTQQSSDVVDQFGEINGTSVKQNLELVEKVHSVLELDVQELNEQDITNMDKNDPEVQVAKQAEDSCSNALIDNQVLAEGLNVSGTETFADTSSSPDNLLLDDQTDLETGLEVRQAEADKLIQPSSNVVDHFGEVEEVSVQENLESVETGQGNVISMPTVCHHNDGNHLEASQVISDNNNEDKSPKSGEVGAFESCERHIDSTDSESALQLKEPSLCQQRKLEGDNKAEGDETSLSNVIESKSVATDVGECLKDHKSGSDVESEFSVADLLDVERSARIIAQDGRIFSDEYSVMASDEQGMYNDTLAVAPITICENNTEIIPKRGLDGSSIAQRDETHIGKSMHSEVDETDQGGFSKGQKSKCDEDEKFSESTLFHAEKSAQDKEIFSGANSIKDHDEQGKFHGSLLATPTTINNCAKIKPERDEVDKIPEGHETYVYKDIQSESAEADEGEWLKNHKSTKDEDWKFSVSNLFDGEKSVRITPEEGEWSKNHKSTKDEDWEFSISNLFDGEKSARITPEDRGILSTGYFIKDINEQVISHDSPAVSTMSASCTEVKSTAGSSSLQEISSCMPNIVSESQGTTPTISNTCEADQEAVTVDTIQEKEAAASQSNMPGDEMSMDKTISSGEHEIFYQSDELTCKYTYEQAAEKPKSPLAKPIAVENTMQDEEASSSASEEAGLATCMLKINDVEETSLVVEGSDTDEDVNDENRGEDKKDLADAHIRDAEISIDYIELKVEDTEETENQCKNLLVGQTQSDVGEEPTGAESSQSWTAVGKITPTKLNDTSSQGTEIGNLIMSMDKSTANCGGSFTEKKKETEGERGSECDGEEDNRLKLLFATPIKIVDETSSHDRKFDGVAMRIPECAGTVKENTVAQTKPDENVQDVGHESQEDTNEELDEVESFDMMHISTENDDGCGAFEERLNDDTNECLKETNFITEEKKEEITNPPGSCLYGKATDCDNELIEKNIISSSGSMKNLDKVEGCQDMSIDTDLTDLPESISGQSKVYLKPEGEMAQSRETLFKLSDVDLKSNVTENSHQLTACYEDDIILRETSVSTYWDPSNEEVVNTGSFDGQKDVIDKGTHFSPSPEASRDDYEVTETKDAQSMMEDDDPYGAKVCDETVGKLRSSHDKTDELHTNSEVATLETVSVGHTLCQEADKHPSTLELQNTCEESGTTIQSVDNVFPAAETGSPIYGAESDNSLPMHLLFGEDENVDIQKSGGVTPVFSFESGHEKNGKEAEENSTAARMAQVSSPELHLEENILDFNDIDTVLDVPASGCNEILKESDVADTIKEYIDSESSLSVNLDDSCGASLPIDTFAQIDGRTTWQNPALYESEDDIDGRVSKSEGEVDKPSVESLETESKELEEATLFAEPAPEAGKESDDLLVGGSTGNVPLVESADSQRSPFKHLDRTVAQNARSILIHGTPGKLLKMAGMKENASKRKSSNVGDFTAVRPAKRRALQDIKWKY